MLAIMAYQLQGVQRNAGENNSISYSLVAILNNCANMGRFLADDKNVVQKSRKIKALHYAQKKNGHGYAKALA